MLKIRLTLMQAGHCTHPEFMVRRGGRRQSISFPALFALLEHPNLGLILFDTGYTARFFTETRQFPYSLYAKITPVYIKAAHTALAQLKAQGITATDIRYVIISHFHADHIGGLADFPEAEYIYVDEAYEAVRWRQGFSAVRAGFLAGLLPGDFETRSSPIKAGQMGSLPAAYEPFNQGWDLLGDGSLMAVPLPGHAHGQIGLFLDTKALGPTFLAADASWQSVAYRQLLWPHPLANLALADPRAYSQTLGNIHRLHQNNRALHIIPSHCQEAWERYGTT